MKPGNGKQHFHPAQFFLPRGRVLLLDDDENDLQHFAGLLERRAHTVRAFTKCQDAMKCLDHEPFDFIIVSPAFEAHHWISVMAGCESSVCHALWVPVQLRWTED